MTEIYNRLSSSYDKLYKLNIQNFQGNPEPIWEGNGWFVDFYPSFGIKQNESCDLLFYGQAVGGWNSGFDLYGEISDDKIENSVLCSNTYLARLKHSPLDWVNVCWSNSTFNSITIENDARAFYSIRNNYRTFRSFFWKVVFKLTSDLYGFNRESMDWSKKVVWSNLFKITVDGFNPTVLLRDSQLSISVELLKKEIEELKPKYCIILTNLEWWSPFKNILKTKDLSYDKSLSEILSFEQYNETKLIITTRPKFWSGENHVKQILQLING